MVSIARDCQGRECLIRTDSDELEKFSFLKIVQRVDPLPADFEQLTSFKKNVYYLVTHDGIKIGFVLSMVINEMQRLVDNNLFNETFQLVEEKRWLQFKSQDFDTRTKQVDRIANTLHDHPDCTLKDLKGWRNEKYAIWIQKTPYVLVERAMSGPFGIITHGCHLNGYTQDPKTGDYKFWIPRRAATKPTWPLMLDNIIAGGLGYPYGPYETVIKESLEEANLEKEIIEKHIKSVGAVNYLYFNSDPLTDTFTTEKAYITGEVEYVYDLKLPYDIIPRPNDGEVDSFNLLSLEEVIDALKNGEFKPNCALIMIDFLMRKGYITPENEPNYVTMLNIMHRNLPFPTLSSL